MADSIKEKPGYRFKKHFEDFVNATEEERERAEKRRDYRDLRQWTSEQEAELEARGQAAVVFDRFSKKVDGVVGLEIQRRTDPKALPIHPKFQKSAEVITDGLRYVESKCDLDETSTDVFEDKIVEGYGGAITYVEENKRGYSIKIDRIPWDRIYFDPYSRRKDFRDSSYFGITLWLNVDDAIALNPERKEEIKQLIHTAAYEDETFEDRPRDWVDTGRSRIRVNQEYYLEKGVWMEVYYSGCTIIIDPKESPYLDENDEPMCPIELESDYVDRDNNRWGWMERLIFPQDEINHRRSKALYMLSSASIVADQGAFGDMPRGRVLAELRKAQSYLEKTPSAEVNIDHNHELAQGQLAMYQDALQAMDSIGANPELTGATENAISGRAFIARQQGGIVELLSVFSNHSNWKKRVYTQIWLRMRQFWTEEKWIRVTDEENALRFVGINVPITLVERNMEQQSGMSIDKLREQAGDQVDEFIQMAIQQNPAMGQIVEKRNDVTKLDMEITIEEAPDTANLQQEQFDTLASIAATRADPQMFFALLELSNLSKRDSVLEKFKPSKEQEQQQAAIQQQQMEIIQSDKVADIRKKTAETQKIEAETAETVSTIPLNEAKTKDTMASAIERIGKASMIGLQ